jgi:hypothetical protein
MQPYFCAYIGYYQLIHSVDKFVICDNMQYTKGGWFNRNRILDNGTDRMFTIPVKKGGGSFANVNLRYLADNSIRERTRILKQIQSLYKKAPFYSENYPLVRRLFLQENNNLFDFINYSVSELCSNLGITTEIIICSSLEIDHDLKGQERILKICKYLKTDTYINAIGGKQLYDNDSFNKEGINLKFIRSKNIEYPQFNHEYVPWLSIIDILMFNGIDTIKNYLNEYELE